MNNPREMHTTNGVAVLKFLCKLLIYFLLLYALSVFSLSLSLLLSGILSPQRHREHRDCTEKKKPLSVPEQIPNQRQRHSQQEAAHYQKRTETNCRPHRQTNVVAYQESLRIEHDDERH